MQQNSRFGYLSCRAPAFAPPVLQGKRAAAAGVKAALAQRRGPSLRGGTATACSGGWLCEEVTELGTLRPAGSCRGGVSQGLASSTILQSHRRSPPAPLAAAVQSALLPSALSQVGRRVLAECRGHGTALCDVHGPIPAPPGKQEQTPALTVRVLLY